jgi:hypothetical protein
MLGVHPKAGERTMRFRFPPVRSPFYCAKMEGIGGSLAQKRMTTGLSVGVTSMLSALAKQKIRPGGSERGNDPAHRGLA